MGGEWRYSPTILDLSARWSWVSSFTPRPLYTPGMSPWFPLYRRLGGPQSRFRHCGEESVAPPGNRTPAVQLLASRYTDWAIPAPSASALDQILCAFCWQRPGLKHTHFSPGVQICWPHCTLHCDVGYSLYPLFLLFLLSSLWVNDFQLLKKFYPRVVSQLALYSSRALVTIGAREQ
jgi:hypothetical protein